MTERPAILIDNTLIFEDGACRELTKAEQRRHEQGKLERVQRGTAKHPLAPVQWLPSIMYPLGQR